MRPTGIGVQGLADVLQIMGYSWSDEETTVLNRDIFAVIYYFALKRSSELAQIHGSYDYFPGSPISKGIFHLIVKQCWFFKPRLWCAYEFLAG